MRRLDRNDILMAASGQMGAAEGATIPGVGTILYRGGDSIQRSMVDKHERLHVELNGADSFGMLLTLVGKDRFGLGKSERSDLIGNLIDLCRTTHEVYATTLAVWTMREEDRVEALADYPDYEEFLAMGELLAGGYPASSMVASALVVGACVTAMQVPLNRLLGNRADWFSKPLETRPSLCPDERFSELLRIVETRQLDFSWISSEVEPRWLATRDSDPYGSRESKRAYHTVLIRVYHQYAWALGGLDIAVLPWDGHLHYRRVPVHAALEAGSFTSEQLSPAEVETLEVETAAASNVHQVIRTSEGQSLQRARFQGELKVGALRDILAPLATDLSLGDFVHRDTPAGLHIVVRPAGQVIASYSVTDEQAQWLRAVAVDGVLTALRRVSEGPDGPRTLLGLMRSPDDLEAVLAACMTDQRIAPWLYSTISMSCLFSRGWRNAWITALRHVTHPVLFADLPPSVFLASESGPDGLSFAHFSYVQEANADPSDLDPMEGVAIQRNRAVGTIERHLAFMGSAELIENFAARLADLPGATYDVDLLSSSPAADAMLHLAIEEPEFQFRGFEHLTPTPLREPMVSQREIDRWVGLNRAIHAHQANWANDLRTRGGGRAGGP